MKKMFSKVFLSTLLLLFLFGNGYAQVNDAVYTNGQLQVIGLKLCNKYGNPIQLRGMSTHGIQWFESSITNASLDVLANDWDADVLRISLYVQEGGYETDPAGFTAKVAKMINMATDRGMYALIDWHQLNPGDPNKNTSHAKKFFKDIATQFKDYNNIIYDICNEPNGVPWSSIKNYADTLIPVIRAIDADAPILIGTHGWGSLGISDGKRAQDIVDNPINFPNIMYTFHFYAASHGSAYINELDWASDRLPIFVTEFGSQNYLGEGANDMVMANKYLKLLGEKKISWINWNYSDDHRSGAVWNTGTSSRGASAWTDANLKESGVWIKGKMLNPADNFPTGTTNPPSVPSGLTATAISNSQISISWVDNSNNENLFRIERSANGTSGWASIATSVANTTSYSNTGLTSNTTYHYRIRTENSDGNSAYSNKANATTKSEESLQYDYSDNVAPSVNPPGGLAVSQVPMFVSVGWDDNAISGDGPNYPVGGVRWIVDFLATKTNPAGAGNKRTYDGTPALNTFISTSNPSIKGSWGEDAKYIRKMLNTAMKMGHEVGNHTRSHLSNMNGTTMTEAQWFDAMNNCNTDFMKPFPEQGIGLTRMFGFRAPRYEFNNNTFKVIKRLGLMYDCSGYGGSAEHTVADGKHYYWPYTMDNGLPGKGSINNHSGIWRMPKHGLIDTDGKKYSSTDYTLLRKGMDATQFLRALKHTFDLRMASNRSPMIFGGHTEIYTDGSTFVNAPQITPAERRRVIEEFLNYVLTFPEVRIVSTKQILDWVRDPVALNDVSNNYDPPNNSQIGDVTPLPSPAPPSSLLATANSNSQINITWTDNSNNEDKFRVERSANGSSGWSSIATVSANTTSYLNTGLARNTIYYYRVRAENSGGNSAYSNTANATTLSDGTTPVGNIALGKTATASSLETASYPASLAVDGSNTTRWASIEGVDPQWISVDLGRIANIERVVLNWETAHATAYNIEVSNDGSAWTSIYSTSSGNGGVDNLSISGTGRYIRMSGTARGTSYGYSLYEFEVYGTIGGEQTAPSTPSGLSATAASSSQIDLSWTDNSNDENLFRIERSANGTSGWTSIATTAANATSYSNASLSASTTYHYRVRAENTSGNSAYSNIANTTTQNGGTGTWNIISNEDFETGWGIWNDGGTHARLYTGHRAYQGDKSLAVQDNTNTSVVTTNNLSLSGYTDLKVDFWYYSTGMEAGEDYWLQISTDGGASFTTVKAWTSGTDFNNGAFYQESVILNSLTLTNTTQLRFRCDASDYSDDIFLDEIVISANANGRGANNIALNKTASSSSLETASYPASFAVDGSDTTRWASVEGIDPQWFYVDLGEIANIERVVLNWETAHATAYSIEVSDNGAAWTSIYSTSRGNGGVDDLSISGTGRYIRMYGTARGTPYGYSLYEFEVYGTFANGTLKNMEPLSVIKVKAYPNPFTNEINYALDLVESAHVTLKLFSLHGVIIDVITDETLPAGNHVIKYNSASLNSGIYIYTIQLDTGEIIYNYLIK